MPQAWWRYPIYYLLITAAAGATLRGLALFPAWQDLYMQLLHAHSHIALLGWGYTVLLLLLVTRFVPREEQRSRFFRMNWLLTQASILGMFISFTLQGYGVFSIAFSTLHILLSYNMAIWLWRRMKPSPASSLSVKFARTALAFMVLSSVGPWSLAVLSAKHMTDSPWYDAALYFYLHCQYNGWYAMGLFAVCYSFLEDNLHSRNMALPAGAKTHYILYTASLLPSFLLSLLWMDLPFGGYSIAVLSGWTQFIAVAVFFYVMFQVRRSMQLLKLRVLSTWPGRLLMLSCVSLAVKLLMELGSAMPALAPLVFSNRSVVIGYLHLVLLGFMSCAALAMWLQNQAAPAETNSAVGFGCILFISGLIYNELLLFLDGLLLWIHWGRLPYVNEQLFIAALAMLAGLGLLGIRSLMGRKDRQPEHSYSCIPLITRIRPD